MPPRRPGSGLSRLEYLMIVVVVALLVAIAIPVRTLYRADSRLNIAKNTVRALAAAVENYNRDFGTYPPDDVPSKNGSEMIAFYLCRNLTVTGKTPAETAHYGPYLVPGEGQLVKGANGVEKFVSPYGTDYSYVVIRDEEKQCKSFVLVDPGPDRELGGSLNPFSGFVPSHVDANKDGVPDDADNLVETGKK